MLWFWLFWVCRRKNTKMSHNIYVNLVDALFYLFTTYLLIAKRCCKQIKKIQDFYTLFLASGYYIISKIAKVLNIKKNFQLWSQNTLCFRLSKYAWNYRYWVLYVQPCKPSQDSRKSVGRGNFLSDLNSIPHVLHYREEFKTYKQISSFCSRTK